MDNSIHYGEFVKRKAAPARNFLNNIDESKMYQLSHLMQIAFLNGSEIDFFKKNLFYGKEGYKVTQVPLPLHTVNTELILQNKDMLSEGAIDILHGLIGIITESVELLPVVMRVLQGECKEDSGSRKSEDLREIIDELGDLGWYKQLMQVGLMEIYNTDPTLEGAFDTQEDLDQFVLEANMIKLNSRYKVKYTNEEAINRDKKSERDEQFRSKE